jgi:hypothetical protein
MYCQKISTATGKLVNCESPEVVTKAHKLLIDCPQKIYHLFRSIGSSSEQEEEEEVVLHPAGILIYGD